MTSYEEISRDRRGRKRRLLAPDVETGPTSSLALYRAQVVSYSASHADRMVSLHEANPGHAALLLSQQWRAAGADTRGSSPTSSAARDAALVSFIEGYEIVKDILVSVFQSDGVGEPPSDSRTASIVKKKSLDSAQFKQNMDKPFHTFHTTPSIDVGAFMLKMRQFHKYCGVESFRDRITLCRALEACVDCEIAALKTVESPQGGSVTVIPPDVDTIVTLTRDAWRAELLLKLKNTLVKITAL